MYYSTTHYIDDLHSDALIELIALKATTIGLAGVLVTASTYAVHELFADIVQHAHDWHRDVWQLTEPDPRPVQAWGVRQRPGIAIPTHKHLNSRYSVVYYLTHGAALIVEDQRIDVRPGLMLTFAGNAAHWTDAQPAPLDRYSIAVSIG